MSVGPEVVTERDGAILVVTINRPGQRNAINRAVAEGIAAAMTVLDATPSLSVGIIRGEGDCFSAGADIKNLSRGEHATVAGRGFAGIVESPPGKPLVAAVEGWALGGGLEIVLACDMVVAGESARFGLPEVRRGLTARAGGAFRLPRRIPHAVAMEVLLTGEPLSSRRAEHLGLVNRVVPDGSALAGAAELARLVARNAPLAVAATKRVAIDSATWTDDSAFSRQNAYFDPVFSSDDAAEGAAAFSERREPVWKGR